MTPEFCNSGHKMSQSGGCQKAMGSSIPEHRVSGHGRMQNSVRNYKLPVSMTRAAGRQKVKYDIENYSACEDNVMCKG